VISFELTEEQELIRDTLKEFASEAMRPIGRDCDESSAIPQDFLDTVWELGLSNTQIPEEYGGGGEKRDPVTNAILLEELGYGDVALAIAATAPNAFVNAIVDYGTEDQKKALLPLFCGDRFHTAALAVLEHGPLADAAAPATKAEPKGEGYVLSGGKSWVVLGDRASHFLVVARNNGGTDAFIVPADAEGLCISEPEKNVGLRGLTTVSLELERVEVGADAKLGGAEGCDVRALLDNARGANSAILVGACRGILEFCIPYTKERIAFDEPISKKQSIAFRMAEMHMEIEAMRWMTWKTASHVAQGHPEATRQAHLTKQYVAEKSVWIADNGIQIFGGHGFIREYPVEMWFRNVRTLSVLEAMVGL
jgi:alkylation response protein AidB-like acyl-CoA dehydrogenase